MADRTMMLLDGILAILVGYAISMAGISVLLVYSMVVLDSFLLVVVSVVAMQAIGGVSTGLIFRLAKQIAVEQPAEGEQAAQ
jgi:hypothetical protein